MQGMSCSTGHWVPLQKQLLPSSHSWAMWGLLEPRQPLALGSKHTRHCCPHKGPPCPPRTVWGAEPHMTGDTSGNKAVTAFLLEGQSRLKARVGITDAKQSDKRFLHKVGILQCLALSLDVGYWIGPHSWLVMGQAYRDPPSGNCWAT